MQTAGARLAESSGILSTPTLMQRSSRFQPGKPLACSTVEQQNTFGRCRKTTTRDFKPAACFLATPIRPLVAITLATLDFSCHTIVCDSRSAIANLSKGRISPQALGILRPAPHSKDSMITLTWIPAHAGSVHPHLPNLNEVPHSIARGLVNRAGATGDEWDTRDNLTTSESLPNSPQAKPDAGHHPAPTTNRHVSLTCPPPPHITGCLHYPQLPVPWHSRGYAFAYAVGMSSRTVHTHQHHNPLSRLREAPRSCAFDEQTWVTQHAHEAVSRHAFKAPSCEA
ncbi:hypothetical protein HPB50_011005 [Hyalomma asiaticum]|uniref:Uncharacterized protein n=1 Tax=Hyalomma asiaticum TaxID=266040 RepID=A0ACB7RYP6_HYAAI|nr:hypothetical protein HPB50_011005 [Hyalomma asiaticum]